MNPLMQQPQNNGLAGLIDFVKNTDPSAAKAQVEDMLQSGGISKERFDQLAEQAKGIAAMLGIK